jgi:hypothetical protein
MKRRTVSVEYEGQVYSYTYADRLKRRKITKWLVLALMVFVVGLVMPVTPEEVNRTMTHFKIVRAVACSAPLLLLGFGYWRDVQMHTSSAGTRGRISWRQCNSNRIKRMPDKPSLASQKFLLFWTSFGWLKQRTLSCVAGQVRRAEEAVHAHAGGAAAFRPSELLIFHQQRIRHRAACGFLIRRYAPSVFAAEANC